MALSSLKSGKNEDEKDHMGRCGRAGGGLAVLPAGRFKTFSVQLRAAYEGRFVLPATTVEAMYEPAVQAATAAGTASVIQ